MRFYKKLKVGQKLILNISLLMIIIIGLVSFVTYEISKDELSSQIQSRLHVINNIKAEKIDDFFDEFEDALYDFERNEQFMEALSYYVNHYRTDNDSIKEKIIIEEDFLTAELKHIKEQHDLKRALIFAASSDLMITSSQNHLLSTVEKKVLFDDTYNINTNADDHVLRPLFDAAKHNLVYSARFKKDKGRSEYVMILCPLFTAHHDLVGVLAFEIEVNKINDLIRDTTGLGMSGETLVTQKVKSKIEIFAASKSRYAVLKQKGVYTGDELGKATQMSVSSSEQGFISNVSDYRGEMVDAVWQYLPKLHWGIVTKIDHTESYASVWYIQRIAIVCGIVSVFVSIIFISVLVGRFMKPILNIRNNMLQLANGEFPAKIRYTKFDEIYDTISALNGLVKRLRISTEFAEKIGEGNLQADFKGTRTNDVLSKALISMRGSLVQLEQENKKRKWATEGIALHAEVLRKNSENIQKLSKSLISTLVQYVGAHHGGLYTVSYEVNDRFEDDMDKTNIYYVLSATYAYDIKSYTPIKFKLGQGLIGQCALEGRTIYLKETPLAFTKISSGLGNASAGFVLLVPLRVNQEILGVLEIASFKRIEQYKVDFIEKLGDSIASSILSVKSSEKTRELLKESELITQDLKKREEELLENQSRMVETNILLKADLKDLKEENKRLSTDVYSLRTRLFEIEKELKNQ